MFEVSIDRKTIQAVEDSLPKLTSYLVNNFCDGSAIIFILNAVIKAVDEIKEEMGDDEDEQNEEDI